MSLTYDWKFTNQPLLDVSSAVVNLCSQLAREHVRDLAELFPFAKCWRAVAHFDTSWFFVTVEDSPTLQLPSVNAATAVELEKIQLFAKSCEQPTLAQVRAFGGDDWVNASRFSYMGPLQENMGCWSHFSDLVVDWLNTYAVPDALLRNQLRVLRAIPPAPQVDLAMLEALWVLECDETFRQGSAFATGEQVLTCDHVLGPATKAFRASSPSVKYPIKVLARSAQLDLASIRIDAPEQEQKRALLIGTADGLRVMDHLIVAGFPNYRVGDSGVVIPGLVVGFRSVRGIQRILTNAHIVAGNSGGPVLNRNNEVVGIAVTGSDRMETARETEDHGIIPIDARTLLIDGGA